MENTANKQTKESKKDSAKKATAKSTSKSPKKETKKTKATKEESEEEKEVQAPENMLYEILGVSKDASQEEIKKGYKKMALLKHPDKNPDDKEANDNFAKLKKAYEILSDPKKRKRYDEYGDDGEGGDGFTEDWFTAYEYYRAMHPKLKKKDINLFIENFRHSKEEEEDLIDFYQEHDGDVTLILESIIGARNDDKERFVKFYDEKIKEGILEQSLLFTKSRKKIKDCLEEAAEAMKEKEKIKSEKQKKKAESNAGHEDLFTAIQKRNQARQGFFAYMEDKYGKMDEEEQAKPQKKRKREPEEKGQTSKPNKKRKTNSK